MMQYHRLCQPLQDAWAQKTGAEYTVSIETDGDGFRHYTVRKDSAVQRAAERNPK